MKRLVTQRAIFVWYILIYKTQHKGGVTFQISFSQHRLQMTLGDTNFSPSIWKNINSSKPKYKSRIIRFMKYLCTKYYFNSNKCRCIYIFMIAVQKIEGKLIWRFSNPQKIFANMQTKRKYIIKLFCINARNQIFC